MFFDVVYQAQGLVLILDSFWDTELDFNMSIHSTYSVASAEDEFVRNVVFVALDVILNLRNRNHGQIFLGR